MTSPADIREWNDWAIPIASRYPKNPDHPFCTGHTYNPLECGLPFGSPEATAADESAYDRIANAFREKGSAPPTLARMAAYLPTLDYRVIQEATVRAARILGVPEPLRAQCGWSPAYDTITLVVPWEAWNDDPPADAWSASQAGEDAGGLDDADSDEILLRPISLHALIERMSRLHQLGLPVRNPIAPMIGAAPKVVTPCTRPTRRIIPAKVLRGGGPDAPRQEALFPLEGVAPKRGETAILPGFRVEGPHPSPLMEVWRLGRVRQKKVSHVVPIEQRIFVEGLLAVPQEDRREGGLVEYSMSLGQFLDRIYPNRRPSRSAYMPAIEKAAEQLDQFRVELYDERTGLWGRHRIIDIVVLPTWTRRPDEDEIRIMVKLPPGSHVGPQVSDQLRYWAVTSRACWNALIGLPFMWGVPGKTLVQPKPGYWARSKEKSRYPVLSPEEIVQVVFPVNENRQPVRQVLLPRALEHLRRLQREGELVLEGCRDGWKILPPEFLAQE